MSSYPQSIRPVSADLEFLSGASALSGAGAEDAKKSQLRAASLPFEPPRSALVSWTIRMAQMADRIISHTLPSTPPSADQGGRLVESTLNGLDRCCRLIPAHQDIVTFERARLQIYQIRESRHARHLRFENMRQAMHGGTFSPAASRLHLNPVSRWIRVSQEPESGDRNGLSASVLFFLRDADQVLGLRMNLEGQVLINELADYQPCTVLEWSQVSSLADARQLGTLTQQLTDIGLVAWSSR